MFFFFFFFCFFFLLFFCERFFGDGFRFGFGFLALVFGGHPDFIPNKEIKKEMKKSMKIFENTSKIYFWFEKD